MKFGFDLRKYNLGKFEFIFDDATTLTIPVPTQKDLFAFQDILKELTSLEEQAKYKTQEELIKEFRKLNIDCVFKVINWNAEGITFTRDEIEEKFDNGACERFLIKYTEYMNYVLGK